uniref:Uncharacterized protein n=1 Tax=Odontella aurita TaxID=265563 RepID=A0A6U6FNA1_9STRA|mmetsp:Transcript_36108/g.108027  ORF Transcript_36108/g.108027 Transcript_36108/m.108027 type:complete len:112 (+) Transcript_36108:906-1241(+)
MGVKRPVRPSQPQPSTWPPATAYALPLGNVKLLSLRWSTLPDDSYALAFDCRLDDANEVDCRGPQQPIAAVVVVVEVVRGDDSCRQRLVRASAPRRGGAAQPAAAATTKGG